MNVVHETLSVLAMVANVAIFILEVWRTWKEHKREDDAERKKKGLVAASPFQSMTRAARPECKVTRALLAPAVYHVAV